MLEGLTTNLINISQLCDQGFKVSFNKGEYVVTNKDHEELIKGSRTKYNFYIWTPESTPSETFMEDKNAYKKKDNDKLTKGSMHDAMLDHRVQHVVSKKERKFIDTRSNLLECQ